MMVQAIADALEKFRDSRHPTDYAVLERAVRAWLDTLQRKVEDVGGAVDVAHKLLEGTEREVRWP